MKTPRETASDELFESYLAWREACVDVRAAYEAWERSKPADRDVAFGGYLAALQQEQHTARIYQGRIELLRRMVVVGSGSGG